MNISQKAMDKIEDVATKVVSKTMGKVFGKQSLPAQVKTARKLMGMVGIVNFRADLLKDRGLPSDFEDLLKEGKSREEIKSLYWECPEFVQFWSDLQLDEGMFDHMLNKASEKKENKR